MRKSIDPRQLGLHHATRLEQVTESEFVIVVDRKSRLIMKDGQKLLQKIDKLRESIPAAKVVIETTAPVCSKTKSYLSDHHISIRHI